MNTTAEELVETLEHATRLVDKLSEDDTRDVDGAHLVTKVDNAVYLALVRARKLKYAKREDSDGTVIP